MGVATETEGASSALPLAPALYCPISAQLEPPDSFVARLQHLLAVRRDY